MSNISNMLWFTGCGAPRLPTVGKGMKPQSTELTALLDGDKTSQTWQLPIPLTGKRSFSAEQTVRTKDVEKCQTRFLKCG